MTDTENKGQMPKADKVVIVFTEYDGYASAISTDPDTTVVIFDWERLEVLRRYECDECSSCEGTGWKDQGRLRLCRKCGGHGLDPDYEEPFDALHRQTMRALNASDVRQLQMPYERALYRALRTARHW